MKVVVTIDLCDEDRKAIAAYYGLPYQAGHSLCKDWVESTIRADLMAIGLDLEDDE